MAVNTNPQLVVTPREKKREKKCSVIVFVVCTSTMWWPMPIVAVTLSKKAWNM